MWAGESSLFSKRFWLYRQSSTHEIRSLFFLFFRRFFFSPKLLVKKSALCAWNCNEALQWHGIVMPWHGIVMQWHGIVISNYIYIILIINFFKIICGVFFFRLVLSSIYIYIYVYIYIIRVRNISTYRYYKLAIQ